MLRTLVTAAVAATAAYGVTRAVMTLGPRFDRAGKTARTNHAGNTVSLIEGPAVATGLVTSAALLDDPRQRLAAVISTATAGVLGGVDDFAESGSSKGLRGHLGALAKGEVTTGGIKVIGIPAAALISAGLLHAADDSSLLATGYDAVVTAGVIAGTANLFNLLDLRPGRALKAGIGWLVLTPNDKAGTVLAAGTAGVIAGVLPKDLAGTTMAGDTGANALGALLGTRFALSSSRGGRIALLLGLVALTLASEKVSFTSVIESTPGLRELDAWGRTTP